MLGLYICKYYFELKIKYYNLQTPALQKVYKLYII